MNDCVGISIEVSEADKHDKGREGWKKQAGKSEARRVNGTQRSGKSSGDLEKTGKEQLSIVEGAQGCAGLIGDGLKGLINSF